ncbi:MAG: universal stress protein [Limisphaerales bacterium]
MPTDFSPESKKAFAYAVAFARQFGAKLTLLHIVEPVWAPDFAKSFPLAMENDRFALECKRQLEQMAREGGIDPELIEKVLVRHGRAYHEIVNAAKSLKVDVIIISTYGYTGLKHMLMGSTTERVVRHASCPVLVVRPSEHGFVVK